MQTKTSTVALGLILGLLLPLASRAQETAPALEEDFSYPDADHIFSETGVRLLAGDGHLEFVSCLGDPTVVRVQSLSGADVCFKITRLPAYLTLELPDVYLIYRGDTPVTIDIRFDGQVESVPLTNPRWNSIGLGAGRNVTESTLQALRAEP
jgi:hypothetical protein